MRDFSQPRVFIFSAARGHNRVLDRRNHCELVADLALYSVPFAECDGHYHGADEQAVVVTGAEHQETVFALAATYHQESVLVVAEHDRQAYLVDPRAPKGTWTALGRFRFAGVDRPDGDAWTRTERGYWVADGAPGPDLDGGI